MLQASTADVNIEVTREDQTNINEFARLNTRKAELRAEVDGMRKELETLNDAKEALEDLIEDDDGAVKLMIGEAFVDVDEEKATSRVEELKGEAERRLTAAQEAIEAGDARMQELKSILYGKFGDAINLEDAPEKK